MTKQRAIEIIKDARKKATIGHWSDQVTMCMTHAERQEVIKVWETMDGSTCFVDALVGISRGKA